MISRARPNPVIGRLPAYWQFFFVNFDGHFVTRLSRSPTNDAVAAGLP